MDLFFGGTYIYGKTKFLERVELYIGVAVILYGGTYNRGFIVFGKLKC